MCTVGGIDLSIVFLHFRSQIERRTTVDLAPNGKRHLSSVLLKKRRNKTCPTQEMKANRLFLVTILVRSLFTVLALLSDTLSPDYDNSMLAEAVAASSSSLSVSSLSGFFAEKRDASAPAQQRARQTPLQRQLERAATAPQNRKVFTLLDPLMRWDAVHFRHIAQHGYTHEHLCAFFPEIGNMYSFFGLIHRDNDGATTQTAHRSRLYQTPSPAIHNELLFLSSHILCSGIAALFLRSILLDLLSATVAEDCVHDKRRGSSPPARSLAAADSPQSLASLVGRAGFVFKAASIVWLINPAAVFFSAAYTETYFALLSFAGIWAMHRVHEECGFLFSDEAAVLSTSSASLSAEPVPSSLTRQRLLLASLHRRIVRGTFSLQDATRVVRSSSKGSDDDADDKRSNPHNRAQSKQHKQKRDILQEAVEEQMKQDAAACAPLREVLSPRISSDEPEKLYSFTVAEKECMIDDDKQAAGADRGQHQQQQARLSKCFLFLLLATLCFVMATRYRSNGILLCGFLLHFSVLSLWFRKAPRDHTVMTKSTSFSAPQRLLLAVVALAAVFVVLAPYYLHVRSCYRSFCGGAESAADFQHLLSTTSSSSNSAAAEDSAAPTRFSDSELCLKGPAGYYSGVQHKYWKVGLFEYYTANNIPNFFIAAPTFLFCGLGALHLLGMSFQTETLTSSSATARSTVLSAFVTSYVQPLASLKAAHVVYLFAQLAIALLIMNVQVVTRFVSSTPALYLLYGFVIGSARPSVGLAAADKFRKAARHSRTAAFLTRALPSWVYSPRMKAVCLGFCTVWALVGTATFSNFMPWT